MPKINDAQLIGDKELRKLLDSLPKRVGKKVVRRALNLASTPILKMARSLVPVDTGTLKKSLSRKVKVFGSGNGYALIGPRKDFVGFKDTADAVVVTLREPRRYAHLVEFGHVSAKGLAVAPKPFLRPAFDAQQMEALEIMKRAFAEGVIKEAKK